MVFLEEWPSISLVRILSAWSVESANHAENLARKNINDDRVEFDPYPFLGYRRGIFYIAW